MRTISTSKLNKPTTSSTLAPMATTTIRTSTTHSPWHTPIPYLFGGLAVMLGLIAFALLMLACSYWSQSQTQQGDNNIGDLENKEGENEKKEPFKAYEEKILVIMAGDQKPTFLATPVICPILGKHDGEDCDTQLGKSEDFNVSEKETLDKDTHVLVHATITIATTQESQGSQETQQQQQQQQQEQQPQ